MSIAAMKQALEALEALIFNRPFDGKFSDTLIQLRAAIAEAEKCKPVAIVKKHTGSLKDMAIIIWTGEQPPEGTPLYHHPQPAIPAGWQLVPVEPTKDIRHAMHEAYWQTPQLPFHDRSQELWDATYKAMLSAAPEPEEMK